MSKSRTPDHIKVNHQCHIATFLVFGARFIHSLIKFGKLCFFLKHRGMHPHQGFLVGFLFPDFDRCFRGLVFQAARKMFSARNWNGRTDHGNVGGFV